MGDKHGITLAITNGKCRKKNSTGYIHGNAKVHLFIDSYDSVCGRYEQDVNYYDDADESEINERDCCKKCWKKYVELTGNGDK